MEGEGKREVPRYRKSSTRKANRLRNSSSSLPSPTCQKFSNRTILPDSLTYSTHEFLTSSPTGKTRRRKYRDLSFRPILPLCKRIPKVRGSRGVDEGEGEKNTKTRDQTVIPPLCRHDINLRYACLNFPTTTRPEGEKGIF